MSSKVVFHAPEHRELVVARWIQAEADDEGHGSEPILQRGLRDTLSAKPATACGLLPRPSHDPL